MSFLVLNSYIIIDVFVLYIVVTYYVIEYNYMETYIKYYILYSEQTEYVYMNLSWEGACLANINKLIYCGLHSANG